MTETFIEMCKNIDKNTIQHRRDKQVFLKNEGEQNSLSREEGHKGRGREQWP